MQRILVALNAEHGWGLSAEELRAYLAVLPQYLSDTSSEHEIVVVATNYHLDHASVQQLHGADPQQSAAMWEAWAPQAVRILQHARLSRPDDAMDADEDLVQVALLALLRALPKYRYASRFSTWAYQVVVQSIQRHFRDQRAAKRAGRPESLDQSDAYLLAMRDDEHPAAVAEAHMFADMIERLLSMQRDQRLLYIFRLWAYEDMRIEEIGRRMQIGPARVRVLIKQIRDILRQHPDIRDWLGDDPHPPDGS